MAGTVTLALALAATPAPSATYAPPESAAVYQRVLDNRTAQYPGSGLVVVSVANGAARVYTAGASGTGRPLDEHTLFEIGSVTKTFTATLLATMVLDGSVALDDPVAKYLPASVHVPTRNGKEITLLQLATQHSGLPRLPDNVDTTKSEQPYEHYTVAQMYDFLSHYTLTRDPGADFEYSNYGVALLGQALANRAGTTYAELLRKRVLEPLGMSETALAMSEPAYALTPDQRERFAAGSTIDGDPAAPWTFDSIAPAGALYSSAADMLKYLRCNMGQGPLAKACLFAQTPRSTFPGNAIGLVWWTGNVRHFIHHGGDTSAYHASIGVSPDRQLGVVALGNGGAPLEDVALHAINPTVALASPPPVASVAGLKLSDYGGAYENKKEGATFAVEPRGDRLVAKLGAQDFYRIYPAGKDTFTYHVVDAKLVFTRTKSGRVNAVVLYQDGQQIVFVKHGMRAPASVPDLFPPTVALTPAQLAEYVANYTSSIGTFYVTLDAKQVLLRLTGQSAVPIFPSAKDAFFAKLVSAQITFTRSSAGTVSGLVLHQNGQEIAAQRQ